MSNKAFQDINISFIVIGAAKSGTTWVTDILTGHPEVFIPSCKEVQFFNKRSGLYKTDHDWNYKRGSKWYAGFFTGSVAETLSISGEFSVDYMYDKFSAELIYRHFPKVKIIVCLRNPVDMVYSYYWWFKWVDKRERMKTFEEAIEYDPEYIDRAKYFHQLKRYVDIFPRENIHIINFDHIKNNPREVARQLFQFLDVDDKYVPEIILKKSNQNVYTRSMLLRKLLPLQEVFRRSRAKVLWVVFEKTPIYKILKYAYHKQNLVQKKYPEMQSETRERLKIIFRDDIAKTEQLTGLDFTDWK
jgi:hypothetical protein